MISGVLFIVIAFAVDSLPTWVTVCLTIWGVLCIIVGTVHLAMKIMELLIKNLTWGVEE